MNAVEAIARGLAKRTGPKPGMRKTPLQRDVADSVRALDSGFWCERPLHL